MPARLRSLGRPGSIGTSRPIGTTRPLRSLVATALLALVVVAACGGPKAPELTDPTAILQAAATEAADATSVHVDLTVDGEVSLDLLGLGLAGPIRLTDTTATADVDIAGGDARITFSAPGVLGLRGEAIIADDSLYAKTSMTGNDYQVIDLGAAIPPDPGVVVPSPDSGSMIADLSGMLADPALEPVKGADVDCGTTTCYTVEIELTPNEVAELAAGGSGLPIPSNLPIPIPDIDAASLAVTIRVEKDTMRLAGMSVEAQIDNVGSVEAEIRFSKWDEGVSIDPPPADQIGG
jgi:hypothetical protein